MNTYTRSPGVRPRPRLAYEHMFPPSQNPTLARRVLGAVRLTRSFLLLEDDYDVDWEVDRDEPAEALHPHRVPLRRRARTRRPGRPPAPVHACLCPVNRVPARPQAHRLASARENASTAAHAPRGASCSR